MFTDSAPWRMDDATGPLIYAYSALRICGILLQPFMPTKAAELLDRLGVSEHLRRWEDLVWPIEVNSLDVKTRLQQGSTRFATKGFLFPSIDHINSDEG